MILKIILIIIVKNREIRNREISILTASQAFLVRQLKYHQT